MDIVFTVPRDKNTNQQIQEGALLAGIKRASQIIFKYHHHWARYIASTSEQFQKSNRKR